MAKQKNLKREVDTKYNLKLYFGLVKRYKWLAVVILFLIFLKEGSRFVDKYLFKIIIDKGTDFVSGVIAKPELIDILIIVALVFAGLMILKAVVKWLFVNFMNILDSNLMIDLKRKFFDHIIHLSHGFHTSNKTGSLISRLIRGGNAVERMSDVIMFHFAPIFFQLIILIGSLIYLDYKSAIVVGATVIVFVAYSLLLTKKQQYAKVLLNNSEDIEKANISDIFTNVDSIKYFGKENFIKTKYKKLATTTKMGMLKFWSYFKWMDAGQNIIIDIGTICVLYFPITSFLSGRITVGTLAFIYTTFMTILGQLYGFVHGIRGYFRSMADFQSLFQYHKIENDIKDNLFAKKLKIKKPAITFDKVTFAYDDCRSILTNFSLKIPANKKVAIVGPSGAGKSTIVKLLYRLHDPVKGKITIDEKDIKKVKQESLRSELSIVPQECVLFDDTIYNNIRFSNMKAKRKDVEKAIKFAQLDKIIKNFPNKEKTIVGERGVKLSGGEKQRVSIARAILADKKVLVLDEATSSLDSETEHEIQKDLEKLMQGRTSIIIAHRLSTVMKADIIVVIENGKIKQKGTHNDLIKHKGIYNRLWNIQKGGYV